MGFFPFGVYLSYIHFMTTMPPELVEAARIDGLGEIAIFLRVGLPISKQAVALVAFFVRGELDQLLPPTRAAHREPAEQDHLDRHPGADRRQPALRTRRSRPDST